MSWLDLVGWLGSALLVYSVMQARVLRFRVVNLAACLVLIGYNAALSICSSGGSTASLYSSTTPMTTATVRRSARRIPGWGRIPGGRSLLPTPSPYAQNFFRARCKPTGPGGRHTYEAR